MKPRVGDVVEVEWQDSASTYGWKSPAVYVTIASRPTSYFTAGYWIKQTGDYVLVALSAFLDGDGSQLSDCISIPRAAVRRLVVLKHNAKVQKALLR